MERTELEVLLFRHRLTFNWSEPANKWWLVGQMKGSNSLARTEPQSAKDQPTAKVAALEFIQNTFK
jgi:hypothetical protein